MTQRFIEHNSNLRSIKSLLREVFAEACLFKPLERLSHMHINFHGKHDARTEAVLISSLNPARAENGM